MKGKAVVFVDRLKASFQEVDIPEPGDNEVVVDVTVSWISNGTESSYFRGERIAGDTPYAAGSPWPFPIVAGYQKVGVVTHVGKNVTDLKAGDRVFATISRVEGMFDPFGGHVSPAVTPASEVWKLPDDLPSADYAGLVLTQVGYNCGMRAPVRQGDCAVVIGDGLVGNWTAQTLLHRGAKVMVLGRHDDRLRYFPEQAVGVNTKRLEAPITDTVSGFAPDGVAVVVDTVGDLDSVYALLPLLGHEAHFVSAGFYGTQGSIDIQRLRLKEVTLHAPAGWTKTRMDETLQAIRDGWLKTGALITHRFPAERAEDAWRLIADKKEPCLGVVLEWPVRTGAES
ncbi:alcohol dehydrogenase catalytic domain-containing protein [Paenibacillus sp. GCM10027626]|uniref:alcohol dehydrogenase catalytic domain-containing protein n=1 Tax=Paenibacillus sp. GCM10027626 TaxID=3273411 RepID=UPI003636597B